MLIFIQIFYKVFALLNGFCVWFSAVKIGYDLTKIRLRLKIGGYNRSERSCMMMLHFFPVVQRFCHCDSDLSVISILGWFQRGFPTMHSTRFIKIKFYWKLSNKLQKCLQLKFLLFCFISLLFIFTDIFVLLDH